MRWAFALLPLLLAGPAGTEIPTDVQRYARELRAVRQSNRAVPLESLFELGISAGNALKPLLERFDEPSFNRVQTLMEGFIVGREEIILAEPKADFFLALARTKGTRIDRDFFQARKRTYPDDVWPVYIEQQTDYSGCRIFGSHALVDTYRTWRAFRSAHSNAYKRAVQHELATVETELETTCVCGGEAEYKQELELFQKNFPSSPAAPKIVRLLSTLNEKSQKMRFHCISG